MICKFLNSWIIQSSMSSFSVLPNFNVYKDFLLHLFFRNKFVAIKQFSFQRLKETFGNCINPAVSFVAHISGYFVIRFKYIYKLFASILNTSIRIKNWTYFNMSIFTFHFPSSKRSFLSTHPLALTLAYNFTVI